MNTINVFITAKFLPFPFSFPYSCQFLPCCIVSVFSCCSPWDQNYFLCWFRYVLCSDVMVDKRDATSFSFGYSECLLFVDVIVIVDCWMLLVFLLYLKESLGTNSLCSTIVLSVVLSMILFWFLILSSRLS